MKTPRLVTEAACDYVRKMQKLEPPRKEGVFVYDREPILLKGWWKRVILVTVVITALYWAHHGLMFLLAGHG